MAKKMSRRDWSKLSLTGFAGLMIPPSLLSCKSTASLAGGMSGVIIGAHTYSFRDMNLDPAIKAMNEIGIKSIELFSQHLEPSNFTRVVNPTQEQWRKQKEALKKWRATVTMDEVKAVKEKIEKAGITIQAYSDTFPPKTVMLNLNSFLKLHRHYKLIPLQHRPL